VASSVLMTSSATFTWVLIPEVQEPQRIGNGYKMPSKALEDLGTGNYSEKANGNGFRAKNILFRRKNRQE
jgi:hypothetical protein